MKMKTCSRCKVPKPATNEYFHHKAASADGCQNNCIPCQREAVLTAPSRLDVQNYQGYVAAYNERHPLKRQAKAAANQAVQNGTLVRQPCEVCGTTQNVQKHHDSYERQHWLHVRWLCPRDHHAWHRQQRAAQRGDAWAASEVTA